MVFEGNLNHLLKGQLKLSETPKLLSQDTDRSHSIEVSLLQCMILQEASFVYIH